MADTNTELPIFRKHDKGIPESLAKQEDGALLRPLYILAAVSPICLLSERHVSTYSQSRMSLQMLGQVSGYTT